MATITGPALIQTDVIIQLKNIPHTNLKPNTQI